MFKINCPTPPKDKNEFEKQVRRAWQKEGIAPADIWKTCINGDFFFVYHQEKLYYGEKEVGYLDIQNKYHLKTEELSIWSNLVIYQEGDWILDTRVYGVHDMPWVWSQ